MNEMAEGWDWVLGGGGGCSGGDEKIQEQEGAMAAE
jgi:hypothetical protein